MPSVTLGYWKVVMSIYPRNDKSDKYERDYESQIRFIKEAKTIDESFLP